jgi:hypothetical protein
VKVAEEHPLILLHELPGLSQQTFKLGIYFCNKGFLGVMHLLFGSAGMANTVRAGLQICLQKELREICLGRDGVITKQIRELAKQELNRTQRCLDGCHHKGHILRTQSSAAER